MIDADAERGFVALAQDLTRKAAALAEAEAARRVLEDRRDPRRWRDARLVWPLFAQG